MNGATLSPPVARKTVLLSGENSFVGLGIVTDRDMQPLGELSVVRMLPDELGSDAVAKRVAELPPVGRGAAVQASAHELCSDFGNAECRVSWRSLRLGFARRRCLSRIEETERKDAARRARDDRDQRRRRSRASPRAWTHLARCPTLAKEVAPKKIGRRPGPNREPNHLTERKRIVQRSISETAHLERSRTRPTIGVQSPSSVSRNVSLVNGAKVVHHGKRACDFDCPRASTSS